MCYAPDGTAAVVGLWYLTGSVADREGSVMFESIGGYDGTTATAQLRPQAGLSSAGFVGVSGSGATSATSETAEYFLDLEF